MWIGEYGDWTPAEQREWDRDLEEMQAEREQRERETKNEDKLSWMELALDHCYEKLYCVTSVTF